MWTETEKGELKKDLVFCGKHHTTQENCLNAMLGLALIQRLHDIHNTLGNESLDVIKR